MQYLKLFSMHNLAMLSDWLSETGELYVDVYLPHSGGGSSAYFVRSMDEFKSLILKQTWREIDITVFRERQYPLRGVADNDLLEKALKQIPDGQPYTIITLSNSFPSKISFSGEGRSHAEFRRDFAEAFGEEVGIGVEPFDNSDTNWFTSHPDKVFQLTVLKKNIDSTSKNQDYYEPYDKEPEKYQWLKKLWFE